MYPYLLGKRCLEPKKALPKTKIFAGPSDGPHTIPETSFKKCLIQGKLNPVAEHLLCIKVPDLIPGNNTRLNVWVRKRQLPKFLRRETCHVCLFDIPRSLVKFSLNSAEVKKSVIYFVFMPAEKKIYSIWLKERSWKDMPYNAVAKYF